MCDEIFLIQICKKKSSKTANTDNIFSIDSNAFSSSWGLDQLKNTPLYLLMLRVIYFILEK